jgi:hypothetical protein
MKPIFNRQTCAQKLEGSGLGPVCKPDAYVQYLASGPQPSDPCKKSTADIYQPVQWIGCFNSDTDEWTFAHFEVVFNTCAELAKEDPSWSAATCYFCCGGPGGTAVGTPEGEAQAEYLEPGDEVSGGSVGPGGELRWNAVAVGLSEPVARGTEPILRLVLGEGGSGLAALPDQVFMRADRSLVRAEALSAGDELVAPDGTAVPLRDVHSDAGCGGVQLIATDTRWNGSPDGHLLIRAGVVAGDYTLQLHLDD